MYFPAFSGPLKYEELHKDVLTDVLFDFQSTLQYVMSEVVFFRYITHPIAGE